jgi:hypothetical protein
LTEIVNPGTISSLPARYIVGESISFAIATPDGKAAEETAKDYMLDLSMLVLHLDGSNQEMSGEERARA